MLGITLSVGMSVQNSDTRPVINSDNKAVNVSQDMKI
jgi:hypothetical protein